MSGFDSTTAPKPCPRCTKPVGEHTVDELREHLSEAHDHDLLFEPVPAQWQNLDVVMCGSVAVKAAFHQSPIGTHPLVIFHFTTTEGPLPPLALILDERHMKSVKTLVSAAVDQAISAAKKAS